MPRPKMKRDEIAEKVKAAGLDLDREKLVVVAIRGYFKNSMGAPGKNDRGIYDDAIFILSVKEFYAYQANTDPSVFKKGMAVLVPGIYEVCKWRHKGQYAAFQIIRDRLKRDGIDKIDEGRHGINIHYGGRGTWSEGCQTLQRADFTIFQQLVYHIMDNYGKQTFKYLLIENA